MEKKAVRLPPQWKYIFLIWYSLFDAPRGQHRLHTKENSQYNLKENPLRMWFSKPLQSVAHWYHIH